MVDLGKLHEVFPRTLTGKQLMDKFSLKQLELLQRVEERSGSDTRRMVERMLSEYMETATPILNISERLANLRSIWSRSLQAGDLAGLDAFDTAELSALLHTLAWGGRCAWTATRGRGGEIKLRSHWLGEDLP